MKVYNKLGFFAAGALLLASCAVNDPLMDKMEAGQVVPTVSWELASSVCKAGNEAAFLGKYYTTVEGVSIDHSEVWAMIKKSEGAAATQKLIPSPAYTKSVTLNDDVRGYHLLKSFPHSEAELKGKEYFLNATFPTSATLGPVNWVSPSEWSDDMFNTYYPENFKEEFCGQMVTYLTKDSTYMSGLRNVYVSYDFTEEQINEANKLGAGVEGFQPIPFSDSEEAGKTKGDLWFDVDTKTIVGYYYTIVDANGNNVEIEIAKKEDAPETVSQDKVFPVYKSPHWIFSRYSDNTGGAVTAVRAEYMPVWKALVEMIPFQDWIYNSSEKCYAVEFSRKYTLSVQFRVIDSVGGQGKDTDTKTIELN